MVKCFWDSLIQFSLLRIHSHNLALFGFKIKIIRQCHYFLTDTGPSKKFATEMKWTYLFIFASRNFSVQSCRFKRERIFFLIIISFKNWKMGFELKKQKTESLSYWNKIKFFYNSRFCLSFKRSLCFKKSSSRIIS